MPRELWLANAFGSRTGHFTARRGANFLFDAMIVTVAPQRPLPKVSAFGETAVRFALAFHLSYVQFSQGYGTDFRPSQRRTAQA